MKKYPETLLHRVCILIIFFVCFSSCQKELPADSGFIVTEKDAAEVIANSIIPTYGGLISKINNTVTLAQNTTLICGINKDSTIVSAVAKSNLAIEFDYVLNWHYWRNCADQSTKFSLGGTNNYSGIHYSASDKSNGVFSLLTKTPAIANIYTIQLFQTRTGSVLKKDIGNKAFTSTVILQSDSVYVDKLTGKILSGKISIKISGTSASPFAYSGQFTFINDHKATLKITQGNSYELAW